MGSQSPATHSVEHRSGMNIQSAQDQANNYDFVKDIAEYIRNQVQIQHKPDVVVVCGSGLGQLADEVTDARSIAYKDIPGFPVGNVVGHKGQLVFGKLAGRSVMCMQGRVHPYEGHSLAECALPIRVASLLGCKTVLMTSAVGGINQTYARGDLMVLNDHIFVPGMALRSPLVGPNEHRFGPRFCSSTNLYDTSLRAVARACAVEQGIALREGVYAMVGGPQFETPAEVRWLANAGADVVGMSVAHETIVARHCGMNVLAVSLVTNMSEHNSDAPMQHDLHEEVLQAGEQASVKTAILIKAILTKLPR